MRLIVVGCGDVGRYLVLGARLNRRIALTAVVDPQIERAQALARRRFRLGLRRETVAAVATLTEALDRAPADAIYLGVPHDLHEPLFREAATRGLAVLCEKPLAHSLSSGRLMLKVAAAHQVKLGVNYQYRYDPRLYRLARGVWDGALGEVRVIRAVVPWERPDSYFTAAPWHAVAERAGGGTLITQGSHALDAALWVAGADAQRAYAVTRRTRAAAGEVEDVAVGVVELAGGTVVELASTMSVHPEQALRLEVYGSRGTAVYRAGRPLQLKAARLPRGKAAAPGLHPLLRSLEGFRRWVAAGTAAEAPKYLCPGREAARTLSLIDALYRAAESGVPEDVGNLGGDA
jgi:predicted dehydrogenase